MKRNVHWLGVLSALLLCVSLGWLNPPRPAAAQPAPETDHRGDREGAVREVLRLFWDSYAVADVWAMEDAVTFPLTIVQLDADGDVAETITVTRADWERRRRDTNPTTAADDLPQLDVQNLRIDWLGDDNCLAVYDLVARPNPPAPGAAPGVAPAEPTAARLYAQLHWDEGWRVRLAAAP